MLTQQVQVLFYSWKDEPLKTFEQKCDLMCAVRLCSLPYIMCGNPRTSDFFSLVPSVIATSVGDKKKASRAKWQNNKTNKTSLIPPALCEAKVSFCENLELWFVVNYLGKGLFSFKWKRQSPDI